MLHTKSHIELRQSSAGKRKGALGTILVHGLLLGMLIIVGFSSPPQLQSEEGILVNFGTDETGSGLIEPSPPAGQQETSPPVQEARPPAETKTATAAKAKEQPLLAQNSEEAPVVKVDPEAAKKKQEKLEADRIIKEQKEAERIRIREEEAEKKRIAAEQQRTSDIMNRTKNALANSKNTGTSSTGEGITGGEGNQGDINGSVDSKVRGHGSGLGDSGTGTGGSGISYNLGGRKSQGALPLPKYDNQSEGRVVVEVRVDQQGKVVQAFPGKAGSTILDEYLLKVAKEAALSARFEVDQNAPPVQTGTITYNFKLK